MTDKMREAFEKWYMTNTFAHVDHLSVFYNDLNCYPTPIANHCWKAWQAAQPVPTANLTEDERFDLLGEIAESGGVGRLPRQSVPVAGEVVGYVSDAVHQLGGAFSSVQITKHSSPYADTPVYLAPTHSISAAELNRLRKDAERYRWLRDANNDPGGVIDKIPHPGLSLYRAESELDHAIDAAIAAEGE